MLTALWLIVLIVAAIAFAYANASGVAWFAAGAVFLGVAWVAGLLPAWLTLALAAAFVIVAPALVVPGLRRRLVSEPLLRAFRKVLPPMSQTEREAIEAGSVWWDGELFSGKPDWRKLLAVPRGTLTPEEQRFLDHDVEELCAMVSDWETTNVYKDLPPHVWKFVKDRGFLGMIIPREYGGLGFSGYAHSQVVQKISTPLGHGGGDRARAELARAGRAPAALRHRRAEAPLPAAPRQGPRNPLLRAHQPERRLRRGVDPGLRCRVLGRARGQEGPGPQGDLGQALHHAGPRRDAPRARVPRLRPGSPRRQQGRDRHHLRADPDVAPGRRHRPPPHAAERGVPERPDVGQGRVHSDGLGDRRTADAGPRLADADGVPRRRARHLAAVVEHRDGEARGAHDRRLRARAPAVQDRDRPLRGHRGGARPHGRQPLRDGRGAHRSPRARSTSARSRRCSPASPSCTSPRRTAR